MPSKIHWYIFAALITGLCLLLFVLPGCAQKPLPQPQASLVSADIGIAGAKADSDIAITELQNAIKAKGDAIAAYITDAIAAVMDSSKKLEKAQSDAGQAAIDHQKAIDAVNLLLTNEKKSHTLDKIADGKKIQIANDNSNSQLYRGLGLIQIAACILFAVGGGLFWWSKIQPDVLLTKIGEVAVAVAGIGGLAAFVVAQVNRTSDGLRPWLIGCAAAIVVVCTIVLIGGIIWELWTHKDTLFSTKVTLSNTKATAATIVTSIGSGIATLTPEAKKAFLGAVATVQDAVPAAGKLVDDVQAGVIQPVAGTPTVATGAIEGENGVVITGVAAGGQL